MIVVHAAITNAEDYRARREPHRQAHIERLAGLREAGIVIGGEARGAGRLAFGGCFEDGRTIALVRSADPAEAIAWFAETGFWARDGLTARLLLHVL